MLTTYFQAPTPRERAQIHKWLLSYADKTGEPYDPDVLKGYGVYGIRLGRRMIGALWVRHQGIALEFHALTAPSRMFNMHSARDLMAFLIRTARRTKSTVLVTAIRPENHTAYAWCMAVGFIVQPTPGVENHLILVKGVI